MKHLVVIHEPTIEIAVAWMNARILLRFERTFLNEFLPNTIVGTEIDVFEELSIEHLVNDARGLLALHGNCILTLGVDNRTDRQKN